MSYWYYVTAQNEVGESPFSEGVLGQPLGELSDIRPPELNIVIPQDGALVHVKRIQVRGRADDVSGISWVGVGVNGESWLAASGTTEWTGNLTLRPGENTLFARATDGWGNNATATVTVLYEPKASGEIASNIPLIAAVILLAAILVQVIFVARKWRGR
jgi:hypothetical protein